MSKKLLFFRSFLLVSILCPVTLIWATICLLTFFLPYKIRFLLASSWNRVAIWLFKYICGIQYQVTGYENLPDEPVILLSKHQSAWETIFLLYAMRHPTVFVLKKELLRIPFFGWTLMLLNMIPIDRSQGARAFRKVIEQGKKRLAEGQWIVIFPEGTRTAVGEKIKYRTSGTRLAIEAQKKVIPIALNSGECWPRHSFIKKPGKITVSIGTPISPEGKSPEEMMSEVETWIESEMRRISPHAYQSV
ncbi:MAG: 1-acyl-sn-glycerol-3-phosphate acyltransferase [Alistipes senegalensis]|nr:1-acyl-sn-glycerol-3-phosphate acyltransferase [Oxalobacter formigenes]MCM1281326.1 1-acyl-sn-glycerol-3-phosphate acyltransferase [Alistipes senegalensis]